MPNLIRTSCLILLFCQLSACSAQSRRDREAALPFRSDLWQQEYWQEKREQNVEDPLPDAAESLANTPQTAVLGGTNDGTAPTSQRNDRVSIPGQARLEDLQQETPIAEWQVDRQLIVEANAGKFRDTPSAWQLSKSSGAAAPVAELSKGPTATTYLVGFMACIVVGGALMTGRES
ncbi:MAG: hypothetical protein NXI04_20915 [Planctomycetaceae bacterium]|nr:hypothetical protein [Planctomycetaceae bacterium]